MIENLTCSPYVLYSARREIIKQLRENDIELMTDKMRKWKKWSHVIYKNDDNKYCYSYSFYEPVINSGYTNNLCIVDDTSCTNYYNYALFVILCVNENYQDQILALALMANKTTKSFINFLIEIKNRVGNIDIFLSDRSNTQLEALNYVWPESRIIYCAVHIGRNIKNVVGNEMFNKYIKMRREIITEEELIDEFRTFINDHKEDSRYIQAVHLLSNLLKETEH